MVWYSHLFKNFPVCYDPHKGFSIVNEAEVDFLEFSCFLSNGCWQFDLWVIIKQTAKTVEESGEIGVLVHCRWEY